MKIDSWPRIFSWPTYSSSTRGRSARSSASSCTPAGFGATMRVKSSLSMAMGGFYAFAARRRAGDIALSPCASSFSAWRMPSATATSAGSCLHRRDRFLVAVAERQQRVEDVRRRRRRPMDADGRRELGAELVLELEQEALGGLLADAGNLGQPAGLLQRHRLRELGDRQARQHGQRDRAPMPLIFSSWRKARRSCSVSEAVQQVRVLAHDEVREQRELRAVVGQVVERAHRHVDLVADALRRRAGSAAGSSRRGSR